MPHFEIRARFASTDIITIYADTETEAMEKFEAGEYDDETNSDYCLEEVESVKQCD